MSSVSILAPTYVDFQYNSATIAKLTATSDSLITLNGSSSGTCRLTARSCT